MTTLTALARPVTGAGTDASSLRAGLLEAGLLVATGVPGLYARSTRYEAIVAGIDRLVTAAFADRSPVGLHFPPVMPRSSFARTSYLESFPDLMGSVHVFLGGDAEHRELLRRSSQGGAWQELLEPGEVVLAPAACHALYPLCAGRLPAGGRWFEVRGECFRHEPSDHPARLQTFRMHEVVVLGSLDQAEAHRAEGLERAVGLLEGLGLEAEVVPANDPFFGRVGTVLSRGQRDEELKLEVVTPIAGEEATAVVSGNCHRDHFGRAFGIEQADGAPAHSACVGFGVDRVVLALLARHGTEPAGWPAGLSEVVAATPTW